MAKKRGAGLSHLDQDWQTLTSRGTESSEEGGGVGGRAILAAPGAPKRWTFWDEGRIFPPKKKPVTSYWLKRRDLKRRTSTDVQKDGEWGKSPPNRGPESYAESTLREHGKGRMLSKRHIGSIREGDHAEKIWEN